MFQSVCYILPTFCITCRASYIRLPHLERMGVYFFVRRYRPSAGFNTKRSELCASHGQSVTRPEVVVPRSLELCSYCRGLVRDTPVVQKPTKTLSDQWIVWGATSRWWIMITWSERCFSTFLVFLSESELLLNYYNRCFDTTHENH